MSGNKLDKGKRRYDLMPPEPLAAVADILGFGAEKYGDRNWEEGIVFSRLYAAALRHLVDGFWAGQNQDPESGCYHVDHALCNLMFLSAFLHRNKAELDDRPTKRDKLPWTSHWDGRGKG